MYLIRKLRISLVAIAIVTSQTAFAASVFPLKLWYDRPAAVWVEALPIGNGRLGAMVFGHPAREIVQLNEDTVWAGGPYRNDNPMALTALPQIRELIFKGQWADAQRLARRAKELKPVVSSQPRLNSPGVPAIHLYDFQTVPGGEYFFEATEQ